jgi:hypothetical protein
MPLNLEQLEAHLVADGLKYRLADEGYLLTGFATRNYVGPGGREGVAIAIRLDEDGEHVEFTAPSLYNSKACRHPAALFEALLAITMRTKLIRFEHDPADGEVRCSIECAIEDGSLTKRQFFRMLHCLSESIDRWDPVIRAAMETGLVNLEPVAGGADHLARLAAVEASAGGIDRLEELVKRSKSKREGPG